MNPLQQINGETLNDEQKTYLDGFFSGLASRGVRFGDVEPAPVGEKQADLSDLIAEERIKRELHPLDSHSLLLDYAAHNKAPDKEDLFRFKWHGLFFLTPMKEAYMARLRIPGGVLKGFQLRELARIAKDLTTGYLQVTTRANLQMRLIAPKDAPEFLRRIQAIGLHTRGSGADNIRNLTASPTSGFDPGELIDVMPLCLELGQIFLHDPAFYDLPRKFNIAYDGGGRVSTVEDTNDIGAKAVRVGDEILFRLAVGGATGHRSFARDLGIVVPPAELNQVVAALTRVYIAHGNRTDRKKARLKHLLEAWGPDALARYVAEGEKLLGRTLRRAPLAAGELRYPGQEGEADRAPHPHLGAHRQKQPGLFYLGASVPVGQVTADQLVKLADLADQYGSGEVRLTVWQNFLLPHVSEAYVPTVRKLLRHVGFPTEQSLLRGGLVACTGSAYCKFAQAPTKRDALALADYLDKRVTLDLPVNIHLTGCPNSCAQHYMGDIGLLGTKVKIGGESVDGYHVFVGGGFGAHRELGRQLFTGVAFGDLGPTLEKVLKGYLRRRNPGEAFRDFTRRHDLNTLQAISSNEE
ncbi:NAD(P)H-dependent nitrite reductase catalytic subunit [Verrucomicrobium sp. GAS474]|uniref:NirA family protein n=1 Tax=Verrucomicrobium sp. GAS474 TaxID=1882831 RepID=UPI00087D7D1A|nr:NirA family protein [Verrucomicrobium sp. GAS474]SDT95413.1 NAD(P)H-dependent nitrite reductase catalytic subunit [Verrucomicrobium sp. GAS474]